MKKTPFSLAAVLGLSLGLALNLAACGNQNAASSSSNTKDVELLNVSYDVSRDFYKAYNPLFVAHYQQAHPDITLGIKQSHGGSSKQALSVANGLQADVVTMNQNADIDLLVTKSLVAKDWQNALPNHAVPFTSATVLLVRQGNPKGIKDWSDLTRPDVQIVMPNPKTSGNGRYAFLGAYGYGLHTFKDERQTDSFMSALLANVAVFDSGARAASTTFTQRGIGDVLITAENEANLIAKELNKGQFEVVYPSYTVAAENPVAVVNAVTDKKSTSQIAHDYLAYLWSDDAQKLAVEFYLRPSNPDILKVNQDKFPAIQTFFANDVFGDWEVIRQKFFAEGAKFDTLTQGKVVNK